MKTTYTAICNNNGCQFLRDGLKKKQAEVLACAHANYCLHDVSIVAMPAKSDPFATAEPCWKGGR